MPPTDQEKGKVGGKIKIGMITNFLFTNEEKEVIIKL